MNSVSILFAVTLAAVLTTTLATTQVTVPVVSAKSEEPYLYLEIRNNINHTMRNEECRSQGQNKEEQILPMRQFVDPNSTHGYMFVNDDSNLINMVCYHTYYDCGEPGSGGSILQIYLQYNTETGESYFWVDMSFCFDTTVTMIRPNYAVVTVHDHIPSPHIHIYGEFFNKYPFALIFVGCTTNARQIEPVEAVLESTESQKFVIMGTESSSNEGFIKAQCQYNITDEDGSVVDSVDMTFYLDLKSYSDEYYMSESPNFSTMARRVDFARAVMMISI